MHFHKFRIFPREIRRLDACVLPFQRKLSPNSRAIDSSDSNVTQFFSFVRKLQQSPMVKCLSEIELDDGNCSATWWEENPGDIV